MENVLIDMIIYYSTKIIKRILIDENLVELHHIGQPVVKYHFLAIPH